MKYYLQRQQDSDVWEEVDEYTFNNMDNAITAGGAPRYSGSWITVDETGWHDMHLSHVGRDELGVVMRFLSVEIAGVKPGGYLQTPGYVRLTEGRNNQRVVVRNMSTGETFELWCPQHRGDLHQEGSVNERG